MIGSCDECGRGGVNVHSYGDGTRRACFSCFSTFVKGFPESVLSPRRPLVAPKKDSPEPLPPLEGDSVPF